MTDAIQEQAAMELAWRTEAKAADLKPEDRALILKTLGLETAEEAVGQDIFTTDEVVSLIQAARAEGLRSPSGGGEGEEGFLPGPSSSTEKATQGPHPALPEPRRTHFLKTWPEYFVKVASGEKRFELRKNDRDFRVGDRLELAEFDPGVDGGFTGREFDVDVTYVLHGGGPFGLPEGYVILSVDPVTPPPPTGEVGGVEPVAWRVRCGMNHPLAEGVPFDWRLSEKRPEIGEGAKPEWFDIEPLFAAPPSREA